MRLIPKLRKVQSDKNRQIDKAQSKALRKADTKMEKRRIKAMAKADKAKLRKEVAEANTAMIRARIAEKKARKELRDIPGGKTYGIETASAAGIRAKKAFRSFINS